MCSNGKVLCLVLRQAELSSTRVWTSPLCWGLLRSCALATSPFPLHTHPEVLPTADLIFLPTSGHSEASSTAVGQEKGKNKQCTTPFSLTGRMDRACSLLCCFPQCGTNAFLPGAAPASALISFPCPLTCTAAPTPDPSVPLSPPSLLALKDPACPLSMWEVNKNVCFLQNIPSLQKGLQHRQTGQRRKGSAPCICFWCKYPFHESLRRHPFDRQHCTPTLTIVAGSAKNKQNKRVSQEFRKCH